MMASTPETVQIKLQFDEDTTTMLRQLIRDELSNHDLAPTGLTHIEQARYHIRQAQELAAAKADQMGLQLVWAIDELLRYIQP